MSKADIFVVSVVRDFAMYDKCVAGNPYCSATQCISYDNRTDNRYITVRYNQFLDSYDYTNQAWFVFCHEDFQIRENIADILNGLDADAIYGPIGGGLVPKNQWMLGGLWPGELRGVITQGEKSGDGCSRFGRSVPPGTAVDTVDCQCLIVHSSLVERFGLRFDEKLSYDLYAEDFCMNAYLRHDIKTRIMPIECCHYSMGKVLPRFFEQKKYLDAKYPNAEAFGIVGYTIGGGRTPLRRFQKKARAFLESHCPCLVRILLKLV